MKWTCQDCDYAREIGLVRDVHPGAKACCPECQGEMRATLLVEAEPQEEQHQLA